MTDFWLAWNSDFVVSGTGGLLMASGDDEAQQRLMRRICTAVKGYIWHLEYGAGLPQKIGDPWSVSDIQALVLSQVSLEASVAVSPPPIVNVSQAPGPSTVSIDIQYTSALTGQSVQFNITV